ncbi:unnamed protein product, partial [Notodromas monacha]
QVISSSLSTSRLSKLSRQIQQQSHRTTTSSSSTSGFEASSATNVVDPLKHSFSNPGELVNVERKQVTSSSNFSRSVSVSSSSSGATGVSSKGFSRLQPNIPSLEIVETDDDDEVEGDGVRSPLVEMPLEPSTALVSPPSCPLLSTVESKFEKKTSSRSSTKIVTDSFTREQSHSSNEQVKRLQTGDLTIEESSKSKAVKAKVEVDGVTAEEATAVRLDQRHLKQGDHVERAERLTAGSAARLHSATDGFSHSQSALSMQESSHVQKPGEKPESHHQAHHASKVSYTSKGLTTSSSKMISKTSTGPLVVSSQSSSSVDSKIFEELDAITDSEAVTPSDVESVARRAKGAMSACVARLKSAADSGQLLDSMHQLIRKAWSIKTHGHAVGTSLCDSLRETGGLDILIDNCSSADETLRFQSTKLLEQCLTAENRSYLAANGLEKVVKAVARIPRMHQHHHHNVLHHHALMAGDLSHEMELDYSRVRTGILESLFKHSEGTCGAIIRMGGLKAVLEECRKSDVETLRHCASALANLSLYGGSENQQVMIKHDVPTWLFPLAFNNDDNIKYYACLAIATMVANKEIEANVLKSGTLDLVEPFVTSHSPEEFAYSTVSHVHGQSKTWLKRLVPVLLSKRKEACALAAFHFAMEAGIKKNQGQTHIFREIQAIEPLKQVASSPNAIASKYAAQALALIGEEVPHKLTQQVPLWTSEDVRQWVEQSGFPVFAIRFVESKVDGDLLLQMTEDMLKEDIGIGNGILRKRFMRELVNLKKMADYSSCDASSLNDFLHSLGPEMSQYTYKMLQSGVDRGMLKSITEEQLLYECSVANSIHRLRILDAIRNECNLISTSEESLDKNLDVFISYRRSNGSQLASLLKVHMQVRRFSAFLDVERLEAGKFDNNLLQSIKQAKHFFLVLT